MAIIDAQNRPSNAQSLAGAAATTVSTDSIDLLSANRNVGRGRPIRAQALVGTAFTGGTSVQAQLITSASSNLASPTVIGTGAVLANPAAGVSLLDVSIPGTAQRYLGFQFTTIGIMTTGTVNAHIVADTTNQPYITSNTGL